MKRCGNYVWDYEIGAWVRDAWNSLAMQTFLGLMRNMRVKPGGVMYRNLSWPF